MKAVFADCLYWRAIVKPDDPWSGSATAARRELGIVLLVTTDEVLVEFLASLSRAGERMRTAAVRMVETILNNPNVITVPQTHEEFLSGLKRYDSRKDKTYSLTDCISMDVMIDYGVSEILTNDHHFEQEGFTILIEKPTSA